MRARLWPAALAALAAIASPAAEPPVALDARPAPLAENLAAGGRTGKMRFRGMLAVRTVTVGDMRFSQLSDIAWDERAGLLYAISDKGFLFHLRPVFRAGMLVDVELAHAVRLRARDTGEPLRGSRADAEGLDIAPGRDGAESELIVSFERFPRIVRFRPDGRAIGEHPLPAPLGERGAYVQANRMLESVCRDPRFGVLTMPEKPLTQEAPGYSRLYGASGESWRYPIDEDNRVTSLACRGDGEVLVLESRFGSRFWRAHTTLKRVRLARTPPDATLEPETLFALESSRGYQIDNFEGIAHHRGSRFFLVSDDNDFFLQRTLLLYFELLDE